MQEADTSPGAEGIKGRGWKDCLSEWELRLLRRHRSAGWSIQAQEGRVEGPEGPLRRRFPKVQVLLREREEAGSPGTGRTTEQIQQLLRCPKCRGDAGVRQGQGHRRPCPVSLWHPLLTKPNVEPCGTAEKGLSDSSFIMAQLAQSLPSAKARLV